MGRLDKVKGLKKISRLFQSKKSKDGQGLDVPVYLEGQEVSDAEISGYASETGISSSRGLGLNRDKETNANRHGKTRASKVSQVLGEDVVHLSRSISVQPSPTSAEYKKTEKYMSTFEEIIESERQIKLSSNTPNLKESSKSRSKNSRESSLTPRRIGQISDKPEKHKGGNLSASFVVENEGPGYKGAHSSVERSAEYAGRSKLLDSESRVNRSAASVAGGSGIKTVGTGIANVEVKIPEKAIKPQPKPQPKPRPKTQNETLGNKQRPEAMGSVGKHQEFVIVDLGSPQPRQSIKPLSSYSAAGVDKNTYRKSANVLLDSLKADKLGEKARYSTSTLGVDPGWRHNADRGLESHDDQDNNSNKGNGSETDVEIREQQKNSAKDFDEIYEKQKKTNKKKKHQPKQVHKTKGSPFLKMKNVRILMVVGRLLITLFSMLTLSFAIASTYLKPTPNESVTVYSTIIYMLAPILSIFACIAFLVFYYHSYRFEYCDTGRIKLVIVLDSLLALMWILSISIISTKVGCLTSDKLRWCRMFRNGIYMSIPSAAFFAVIVGIDVLWLYSK